MAAAALLLTAPQAFASRTPGAPPDLLPSPALESPAAAQDLVPAYVPQGFELQASTDPHPAGFALFPGLTPPPTAVEPERLASGVESWELTPNLQQIQVFVCESWQVREKLGPIDSPNLYQAFGLDPQNNTDPFGLSSVCDWYKVNGGTPPPECLPLMGPQVPFAKSASTQVAPNPAAPNAQHAVAPAPAPGEIISALNAEKAQAALECPNGCWSRSLTNEDWVAARDRRELLNAAVAQANWEAEYEPVFYFTNTAPARLMEPLYALQGRGGRVTRQATARRAGASTPPGESGLAVVARPGMTSRVKLDASGRPVTIYGQGEQASSRTPGHAEAINDFIAEALKGTDVDYVTVQRSWRTATGRVASSRLTPDVILVRRSGRVDAAEVISNTDDPIALRDRLRQGMATLPPERRGVPVVLPPRPGGGS